MITPQAEEPTEREIARKAAKKKRNRQRLIAIAIPILLGLLYYLIIAPAAYHARAQFTIQGTEKEKPDVLTGLGIPSASGQANDAELVVRYLKSEETVTQLRTRFGFEEAYAGFRLDPASYLPERAPIERATDFWQRHAKISYDPNARVISLDVKAYDPAKAKRLVEGLLSGAQLMVTQLDRRSSNTARTYAEQQLAERKAALDEVKARVAKIRGAAPMTLDAQAAQSVQTITQIDSEIAKLRVDLELARTTFQPNTPQVKALENQINVLNKARAEAVGRARRGLGDDVAQSDLASRTAMLDYEFAQKSYQAAQQAYQNATQDTREDTRYLVSIVPPRLPERSDYFTRLWNLLALAIISAILVGVGMLALSIVKEHT